MDFYDSKKNGETELYVLKCINEKDYSLKYGLFEISSDKKNKIKLNLISSLRKYPESLGEEIKEFLYQKNNIKISYNLPSKINLNCITELIFQERKLIENKIKKTLDSKLIKIS